MSQSRNTWGNLEKQGLDVRSTCLNMSLQSWPKVDYCSISGRNQHEAILKEEQQKNRQTSRPTFYRDLPKPSTSRTTAVHVVDVEDMDSEERDEEVFLEEEKELAGINLEEIVVSGPQVFNLSKLLQ
ncbi:unnamed protein product [Prunus armeniaca]|uniref:Uncharacterized protein n=1 Tax=Prunus armeniaca TaxID=36596 RepID=A0A6J5TXG7_PRUAR|nr:unnamed protein product [Prunus armeniaca]CAB4294297.1 unnamed protein product [Prunus armeniaca]